MIGWSDCDAVESIPGKMSGAWVLKGTRFPIQALFDNLDDGATIEEVADWFEVDEAKLHEVLKFLSDHSATPVSAAEAS